MSTDTDDRTHEPAVMIDRYLTDCATIANVEQIVAESQTLLEVQRGLRIPRHHARPLEVALGLENDLPGSAFLKTGGASDS